MENNITQRELSDGINFTVIKDPRFKTARISLTMFLPLSEETASANAVLPFVLTHACRKYPDFSSFNKCLSNLYGASVYADVNKMGDMQTLTLSASFLDDRYVLDNENISSKLAKLLCDIIFNPLLIDGKFSKAHLDQEKRQIIELINSEYNDKRTYAKIRCEQIMFKNEKAGIRKFGSKEQVAALNCDDIYEAWKRVLRSSKIELIVLGNCDETAVFNLFKDAFSKIERKNIVSYENKIVRKALSVKQSHECMDIAQCKLVMGFRTYAALVDKEVFAMRVMISLLGATPHSKLFLNVREKQSLCYYCSSKYDRIKGVMFIQSGVEKENIEKAKIEILKQLDEIKKGNVTENELSATKKSLSNSFRTISDYLSGLENLYITQVFDGKFCTPDQFVEKINTVTIDEVINAANMVTLDTVYSLESR